MSRFEDGESNATLAKESGESQLTIYPIKKHDRISFNSNVLKPPLGVRVLTQEVGEAVLQWFKLQRNRKNPNSRASGNTINCAHGYFQINVLISISDTDQSFDSIFKTVYCSSLLTRDQSSKH